MKDRQCHDLETMKKRLQVVALPDLSDTSQRGRNIFRRARAQQARVQEAEGGTWPGWQGGGERCEGSGDGIRYPARVVERTDKARLQGFVAEHVPDGATVYTDEARAYDGLPNRESVKHSVAEYVRGVAHTNGVESFWSMLKRAHKGTFHKFSAKHPQRYVDEFPGRHNIRELDAIEQMQHIVAMLVGKRLMYRDLIAE